MNARYEKPIVEVTTSKAEGVYAASGNGKATCGSNYMSPETYTLGTWTQGDNYWKFYGCSGCTNSARNGVAGCALINGEYDKVVAANNGDYTAVEGYDGCKPRWERENYSATETATVTYLN